MYLEVAPDGVEVRVVACELCEFALDVDEDVVDVLELALHAVERFEGLEDPVEVRVPLLDLGLELHGGDVGLERRELHGVFLQLVEDVVDRVALDHVDVRRAGQRHLVDVELGPVRLDLLEHDFDLVLGLRVLRDVADLLAERDEAVLHELLEGEGLALLVDHFLTGHQLLRLVPVPVHHVGLA